jgi:hypothetical protein
MNVLEARVVLRDRSLLDVVDLAVRFLVRHAKKYAALSAIVLPPVFLVTWVVAEKAGWGWGWAVAVALGPFAAAPFTALASRLLFEQGVRLRDVFRAAGSVLLPLIGLRILEGLALSVGFIFFILPALWFWALFFFANEVTVLERARVGAGLVRLNRLLLGQSGEVISALLFLTGLHIIAVFLGDAVGRGILTDLFEVSAPESILQAKGTALGLAAFWLFVPVGATCRFLIYINGRTRTEGWDVQTRFAAIAARAETDAEVQEASRAPRSAA